MTAPFTGGCGCGAIRYECSTEPLMAANCHCRDCQRSSGAAFSAVVVVPADSLKLLKGGPTYYRSKADSGTTVQRGFCSNCGSPLFAGNTNLPHIVSITVGSLDDPSWCKPMIDIWTQSAQPWDYMNPDIPKVSTQPQM